MAVLDFEKPIFDLESKIEELKLLATSKQIDLSVEIRKLEKKLDKVKRDVYSRLTDWQRVQLARHPNRPYTLDYVNMIFSDFIELHGDRLFADDAALIGGLARLEERSVMIIGHQKGRDTKENIRRNFGCAHPEGYRKAMRLMQLAAKFRIPVISFIDTPGAYPGIGAEERGQAQAIAMNLKDMALLPTPIVAVVIGEGGSGGAIGIGVADRVAMLENAYYSVISPEGCASILWRNSVKAPEAAAALKLTSYALKELGLIDDIVPEPLGGAHRDPAKTAQDLKDLLLRYLNELNPIPIETLLDQRYQKYRRMGVFAEGGRPNDSSRTFIAS